MPRRDDDEDDDRDGDDEDDDDERRPSKKKRRGPTKDDRQMAMFCHLGGIFGGFVLPLVIWLMKKDESSFIDDQGKEALNFHITMIGAGVISCGLLLIVTAPLGIVFSIIGAMAANRGEYYRYPISIRFIS